MKQELTVIGYDIVDVDPATVQAFIGGVEQTVLSVDATSVVIQVDDVTTKSAQSLEVYFEIGAPNGMGDIYSGVDLMPEFLGLSTSQGSEAGSTFSAFVEGVGVDDTVMLVDTSDDSEICMRTKVISYGVVECMSKAVTLSTINVAVKVDGTKVECMAGTGFQCTYETYSAAVQPKFATPSVDSATQVTLIGTNLSSIPNTQGCMVSYVGVEADSCTIDGSGNAVAVWTLGIPAPSVAQLPILTIIVQESSEMIYSKASPVASTDIIDNTLMLPASQ